MIHYTFLDDGMAMKDLNVEVPKMIHKFTSFRTGLITESDRGCALYAAAYIETALGEMLAACMVQNPNIKADLFKSNGPLSTFSSRIKMAYYLGKISPSERKDLDNIRDIRNDFAHDAGKLTFDNQSIHDRCKNFTHNWREDEAGARTRFTATVSALLLHIGTTTLEAVHAVELDERTLPQAVKDSGNALVRKLKDEEEAE